MSKISSVAGGLIEGLVDVDWKDSSGQGVYAFPPVAFAVDFQKSSRPETRLPGVECYIVVRRPVVFRAAFSSPIPDSLKELVHIHPKLQAVIFRQRGT